MIILDWRYFCRRYLFDAYDIAVSLGYNNASKFAIAFQSVYGVLPKDYRKQK